MKFYIKNEKVSDIFIKSLIYHTEIKPPEKINSDFFEKACLKLKLNQFLNDLKLKGFNIDKKLTALILKAYSSWDGFNFEKIGIFTDKHFKEITSFDFSYGLLKEVIKYFLIINSEYEIPSEQKLLELKFINSVNTNGLEWTLLNEKINLKDKEFMRMINIYKKVRKDIEIKFNKIKTDCDIF